jgi:hypothetical protein
MRTIRPDLPRRTCSRGEERSRLCRRESAKLAGEELLEIAPVSQRGVSLVGGEEQSDHGTVCFFPERIRADRPSREVERSEEIPACFRRGDQIRERCVESIRQALPFR